ncbi:class I SAM-dependent methyltransferase [Christensenellaceae bacterium OttesenSCG-928-M15]|nr:class I SAM-dependent methyltransferase [Christensenellaceae bacterium OttesenSCG-928-M15]
MNREKIISNYEGFDEDKRAYGTRAEQIEFIYTKKLLDEFISPSMSVIEVGCGTGYYGFYLADKCRAYHGVDLTPKHIVQFQAGIDARGLTNLSASVGDAANLSDIADRTYDVVLLFGPMYHLPKEERAKVIRESARICKRGGIIMFAYINKIGAYLRGCVDTALKDRYPNKRANELVLHQGVDDVMPDVFFFTMPEEIEADAAAAGLSKIRNAGVDFTFNASDINTMDDDKYTAWTEIMDTMFHSESCTGVSNHAVLVCRKP